MCMCLSHIYYLVTEGVEGSGWVDGGGFRIDQDRGFRRQKVIDPRNLLHSNQSIQWFLFAHSKSIQKCWGEYN